MALTLPGEGTIVEYSIGGLIGYGYVKGYIQPPGKLVIQPYRMVGCLKSTLPILRSHLPCIALGRSVPLLDVNRILRILSPWRAYRDLKHKLPGGIIELLNILEPDLRGITGSWALGCEGPNSDVDILVYSKDPEVLSERLLKLQHRGIIKQCSLERVKRKRLGRNDFSLSDYHILRSPVESCIDGTPYTLRVLREPYSRLCEPYEPGSVLLGQAEVIVDLKSEEPDNILVPSRYRATVLSVSNSRFTWLSGRQTVIESWRTRYSFLESGRYLIRGELFIDINTGGLKITPDFVGGVWRVG